MFDPFFSVYETLSFQMGYFGKKTDKKWIIELLNSLGLSDKIYSNMRTLSGGMKRRVLLAQALVHKPEVVVLDEPTAGVDVQLRSSIWDLIKKINRAGTTILLTTHYLEEAEQLCNKTAIVNNGNLITSQETKNFFNTSLNKSLLLKIKNKQAIDHLNIKNVKFHDREKIEFSFSNLSEITELLNLLNTKKIEIISFEIKDLDLEKFSYLFKQLKCTILVFTLLKKKLLRFYKLHPNYCSSCATSFLFLIVFSSALSNRVLIGENSYINFNSGLIMMTILQNSFANSSSSLTQSKITGNLIFILLAPLSNFKIFLAYSLASAIRGLVVGLLWAFNSFYLS